MEMGILIRNAAGKSKISGNLSAATRKAARNLIYNIQSKTCPICESTYKTEHDKAAANFKI